MPSLPVDSLTPAQHLWARVLEESTRDYTQGLSEETVRDYKAFHREQARDWIYSESEEPGSFLWVCEHLSLNPQRWREASERERQAILSEQVAALGD